MPIEKGAKLLLAPNDLIDKSQAQFRHAAQRLVMNSKFIKEHPELAKRHGVGAS